MVYIEIKVKKLQTKNTDFPRKDEPSRPFNQTGKYRFDQTNRSAGRARQDLGDF